MSTLGVEVSLVFGTARRFAETEIAPLTQERPHDPTILRELLPRMAELGFLGGPLPTEMHGAGLDYVSYVALCEAIGGVSPSIFTGSLTIPASLFGTALAEFGTDSQREKYLTPVLRGRRIPAFALTEPDVGSDPGAARTLAERVDGGWRITGSKMWISNGTLADVILVFAQTEPGSRNRGLTAFLVEGDATGLTRQRIDGKLGLDQSDTATLFLDSVHVSDDQVMGDVGQGFRIAQTSLERGRLSTAACAVGIGQRCLDISIAYAKERAQWGKAIAAHQLIQEHIVQMATDVRAARLLTMDAAADLDAKRSARLSIPMAKYFATETAVRAARTAISIHGAMGYVADNPITGLFRDAIGLSIYEGTTEIQKLMIGRELLGVAAFA